MYNDPRVGRRSRRAERRGRRFLRQAGLPLQRLVRAGRKSPGCETTSRPSSTGPPDSFTRPTTSSSSSPASRRASDYSNALKTGYDLIEDRWPAWIDEHLGIVSRLPSVVAPGSPIGTVSRKAAAETGLPEGLRVVAGATDGTAAFLASGARRIGDYNTTLGTTLVFKGISSRICRHPQGVIYCHKLPGGWWLPGAASNVGTDWIGAMFPGADVQAMDAAAAERLPSECLAYPLVRTGERFPFLAPDARGFFVPEVSDPAERYAACLQGVALVERLGIEVLDAAGTVQFRASENGTVPVGSAGEVYAPAAAAAATSGCNAGPTRPAG